MSSSRAESLPVVPAIDAVRPDALAASFDHCKRVARTQARNFYYGMKLTPEPRRSAMYAIYAWMRAADDLADNAARDAATVRAIDRFRELTHDALDGRRPGRAAWLDDRSPHAAMWPAVEKTLRGFHIPGQYLDAMIEGQLLDQRQSGYENFAELDDYCYKVAGVVGLTCITVWGYTGGEATRELAKTRGLALQLTNILRDLVEDAQRGRVYLPAEELAQFGYESAEDFRAAVLRREADGRFDNLMAFQIDRAQSCYDRAAPLESAVTPNCRPTCWAMMEIYHALLEKIAANPRGVLTGRVKLRRFGKAMISMRATWRRRSGGDGR
jgi:phytoene synthase